MHYNTIMSGIPHEVHVLRRLSREVGRALLAPRLQCEGRVEFTMQQVGPKVESLNSCEAIAAWWAEPLG